MASIELQAGVRRRPVQRRSIERFERILDACAQLLDEVGFDELTTQEVARRSDVPIGTIYQFFDGKNGMLRELGLRNLDSLIARVRDHAKRTPITTWEQAAEIVIDEDAAMMRTAPGFTVMDFGDTSGLVSPDLIAERLYSFAIDELGLPELPDAHRVIMLAIAAGGSAITLAFRESRRGDDEMIAQGKRLVLGYLASTTATG